MAVSHGEGAVSLAALGDAVSEVPLRLCERGAVSSLFTRFLRLQRLAETQEDKEERMAGAQKKAFAEKRKVK
jgi:hypothetical protein